MKKTGSKGLAGFVGHEGSSCRLNLEQAGQSL